MGNIYLKCSQRIRILSCNFVADKESSMKPLAVTGSTLFAAGLATVSVEPASMGLVFGQGFTRDFMRLQVYAGIPMTVIGAVLLALAFSSTRR
jgi:hypothetical protein